MSAFRCGTGERSRIQVTAKTAPNKFQLNVWDGIYPKFEAREIRQEILDSCSQKFADCPEKFVKLFSYQWYNFFDFVTKAIVKNNRTGKRMTDLKNKLKEIIIEELKIQGTTPEEISNDEPLFGEGLGLDSLDAVELVVLIQKHFNVQIADMEEGQKAFTSINTLAEFIKDHQEE